MRYNAIEKAVFLQRPNRFIAIVALDGKEETVHVKNTGRCKELLVPGCTVYLAKSDNPKRKTRYDLVAVEKERRDKPPLRINLDSQMPNAAVEEWLRKGLLFSKDAVIQREKIYGNSRFDFYIQDKGRQAFLEVKGVTLEEEGIAMFPDAPTERGVKHLQELCKCIQDGYDAYVIFVVQMKEMRQLQPNWNTHPAFGEALLAAKQAGVQILCMDCIVQPDEMLLSDHVPIILEKSLP